MDISGVQGFLFPGPYAPKSAEAHIMHELQRLIDKMILSEH
jgi:hypothetical protein